MTEEQRATLRRMGQREDDLGRAVAAVRIRGGTAQEMAEALAALDAAKQEAADYCARIGFRVVGRFARS